MAAVQPIRDKRLVREIINYFKKTNERDYLMVLVGFYTGLRISDILNLRVKDVRGKRVLNIVEQKTRKKKDNKREIIVHKELKNALASYTKDKDPMEFLIKSREGRNKPITREHAYRILKKVSEKFGIERIGTHTLRKTYGYNMYFDSKKDVVLVQKALNQSHPSITLRYIGIEQESIFDVNMRLNYN